MMVGGGSLLCEYGGGGGSVNEGEHGRVQTIKIIDYLLLLVIKYYHHGQLQSIYSDAAGC